MACAIFPGATKFGMTVPISERLREERDRFVGFAFSNADVLLELDETSRVLWAGGAVKSILGVETEWLTGKPGVQRVIRDRRGRIVENVDLMFLTAVVAVPLLILAINWDRPYGVWLWVLLAQITGLREWMAMTLPQESPVTRWFGVVIGVGDVEQATHVLKGGGVDLLWGEGDVKVVEADLPGVAVSRERLLAASHGRSDGLLPRAIDVAVMRLRKRVEPDPAHPRFLQTIRGHGYMFVPAMVGAERQRSRRSTPAGAFASPSMNSV